jgi:hypothetical protein
MHLRLCLISLLAAACAPTLHKAVRPAPSLPRLPTDTYACAGNIDGQTVTVRLRVAAEPADAEVEIGPVPPATLSCRLVPLP